jgi:hypothetical protein
MNKQWQSNNIFHTYYLQLKRAIEVEPHMTPNILQRYRPLMKFCTDQHFIYLTAQVDEHKEQLQSYYKLMEEDLEEITKDWSADLLIPTHLAEMSDPELDSLEATHKEQNTPSTNRRKKIEEVQDLSSASHKIDLVSPDRGDDYEVKEINGKGSEQKQGKVTLTKDKVDPLKKRKVSPLKPSSWKKSRATMTNMKILLTTDDFDFIIALLNDALLEIMEKQESK